MSRATVVRIRTRAVPGAFDPADRTVRRGIYNMDVFRDVRAENPNAILPDSWQDSAAWTFGPWGCHPVPGASYAGPVWGAR